MLKSIVFSIIFCGLSFGQAVILPSGLLSDIATGGTSNIFLSTDQKICSPIYIKIGDSWIQSMSLGGSGALSCSKGTLDINTNVLGRLAAENVWTGLNSYSYIKLLKEVNATPCDENHRGWFRFRNKGSDKDLAQVCGNQGSGKGLAWMTLN